MSDNPSLGFAKFVPGFDFLQNLAKGAGQSMPQLPSLSSWVAPTLSVEELDKRIEELKAVQFWLDQNSKALSATVQALQVQRMTLSTLKGMNVTMGDLANALKLTPSAFGSAPAPAPAAAPEPAPEPAAKPARRKASGKSDAPKAVDPLQWWGSLTQQFQQIAASAMADAARSGATEAAMAMATGVAKEAAKAASGAVRKAASPAAKAAAPRKASKRGSRGAT